MAIKAGSSGTGGVSSSTSTKTESSSAVKTGSSAVGGTSSGNSSAVKTGSSATGGTSSAVKTGSSATGGTSSAVKTGSAAVGGTSSSGGGVKSGSSAVGGTSSSGGGVKSGAAAVGGSSGGGTASAVSGDSGTNNSTGTWGVTPSTAAFVGGSSGGGLTSGSSSAGGITAAVGASSPSPSYYLPAVGSALAAAQQNQYTPSTRSLTSAVGGGSGGGVGVTGNGGIAAALAQPGAWQALFGPAASAAQPRVTQLDRERAEREQHFQNEVTAAGEDPNNFMLRRLWDMGMWEPTVNAGNAVAGADALRALQPGVGDVRRVGQAMNVWDEVTPGWDQSSKKLPFGVPLELAQQMGDRGLGATVREIGRSYGSEDTNPNKDQSRLPINGAPVPYDGWRADGGDFPATKAAYAGWRADGPDLPRGANGANDNLNMVLGNMAGRSAPFDAVGPGVSRGMYDDYVMDQMGVEGGLQRGRPDQIYNKLAATLPERASTPSSGGGWQALMDYQNGRTVNPAQPDPLPGMPQWPLSYSAFGDPGARPDQIYNRLGGTLPEQHPLWRPTVAGRPDAPLSGIPAAMPPLPRPRPEAPYELYDDGASPRDDIGPGTSRAEYEAFLGRGLRPGARPDQAYNGLAATLPAPNVRTPVISTAEVPRVNALTDYPGAPGSGAWDETTEMREAAARRVSLPETMNLKFNVEDYSRGQGYYGSGDNPGSFRFNAPVGDTQRIDIFNNQPNPGPVSPKTDRRSYRPDQVYDRLGDTLPARAALTPERLPEETPPGRKSGAPFRTKLDALDYPAFGGTLLEPNWPEDGYVYSGRNSNIPASYEGEISGFDPKGVASLMAALGKSKSDGYLDAEGNQNKPAPGQVEFEDDVAPGKENERVASTRKEAEKAGKYKIQADGGVYTKEDIDKLKKDNDPVGKWFNSTPLGVIIDFLNGDEEDAGGGTPWFEGMFGKGGDPSKAPKPLVDPVVGGSQTPRDANGNGIPDDMEIILGPLLPGGQTPNPNPNPNPNTPTPNNPNNPSLLYDRFGDVVFPALPPYNPGVDPEHLYFRKRAFADGGLVDAYAEGGTVTGLDMQDPRVETIAKAEDALEDIVAGRQPSAEERKALEDFTAQFGQEALKSLYQNVQSGMTMKGKPRMVEGPGGPQDDAIPARVENVEEAALSNGEFVMPAEAVAEMGEGDPMVGAQRLQELSERLTGARRQPEVNVERVS